MSYLTEPDHTHGQAARTGILLINLGTPEAPTAQALRPYLKEFLSDPRVVEIPRAVWWLILNGFILNTRPKKSAEKYAAIWTAGGSPLKVHTEKQAKLPAVTAFCSCPPTRNMPRPAVPPPSMPPMPGC
jgi:ferrochelatase